MTTPGSVREILRVMRERYRARSGAIVGEFTLLAAEVALAPHDAEVLDRVRREAHRIRGTAGTYGFAEASELAAALEMRAERWAADPGADAGTRAEQMERFAIGLAAAFAAPRDEA